MEVIESVENHRDDSHQLPGPKAALTPPTSEDMEKRERSSSDLSDIEEEDDDIGDVEPDHFYDGGNIPVFKPTMQQFKSFRKFIDKIDRYGMKSGIVKVIPPKEWRDSLPDLADKVKTIKVKNPITQEFAGQHGVYTQANIEKQRSYNLPQWKALTEETHHQPPAKRGERRNNQAVVARSRSTRVQTPVDPDAPKRKPGRPPRNRSALKNEVKKEDSVERDTGVASRPSTPSAKGGKPTRAKKIKLEDDSPSPVTKGRQPKSISSRRKNNQGDVNEDFDEEAFKGFQYRLESVEDYTPERCKELETLYWKTINFAHPMYGADMPGSLFDESTDNWNVAKLENLLDVLGTKVPGVNTAYLYLGMWKATFAWHLEDVDLYSINYIHFGAPKQWYSISQQDARRFENAMKTIWPNDFKNCSQFLRHKTYLISPSQLESQFNIKVNRLVHNEGEFVITYPYGYHSGYNLGYNCAESVNFATEAWLEFGKIAKKCDCEADSVWVDVSEIERKLRGEPTPEYYEETDDEDDEDDVQHDLPSPPASVKGKPKAPTRKRKRNTGAKDQPPVKTKRIKIRVRIPSKEPCVLCPNEALYDKLLPTDNGQKAHRLCALYTPETFISEEDGFERVCNVAHIEKARLDLKCNFCRSKRGACFQCSSRKCTRAFHATCAAAAGVLVDTGPVPTFDEDGTEYFCEGYDFRCKVHRPRRPKHMEVEALENNKLVQEFAKGVKPGEVVQAQWLQGDPVAGVVLENRTSEGTVIIDVLPAGSHVEVEWKYLLVLDPKDSQRPKPSPSAKELPLHLNNSKNFNAKNQKDGPPEIDTPFHDPNAGQKWAEFNTCFAEEVRNPFQIKINLDKPLSLWYYLGKNSTEARPQYTGDASKQVHDIRSNFLETVKPPPRPPAPVVRRTAPGPYPTGANVHALNGAMASQRAQMQQPIHGPDKPYEYKPKSISSHAYSTDPRSQAVTYPYGHMQNGQNYAYYPHSPHHQYHNNVPNGGSPPNNYIYPSPAHSASQQSRPGYSPPTPHPQSLNARSVLDPRLDQISEAQTTNLYHQLHYHSHSRPSQQHSVAQYPNYHNHQVKQSNPFAHQHPQQQHSQPLRVAPVANMMATPTPTPPAQRISAASNNQSPTTTVGFSYFAFIQQYPYLRNETLRRPSKYVSPYPGTSGFSPEYQPLGPISKHSHSRHTSVNKLPSLQAVRAEHAGKGHMTPIGLGIRPGSGHSFHGHGGTSRQHFQPTYQTAQQFQDQMRSEANTKSSETTKFERIMQQLGNAGSGKPGNHSSNGPYGAYGGHGHSQGFAIGYGQPSVNTPQAHPYSPKRPDYSPLSDAGGNGRPSTGNTAPISQPGMGFETWNFT